MNEAEARDCINLVRAAIGFPFEVEIRFQTLNSSLGRAYKQGQYRRITLARQFLAEPEAFGFGEDEFYDTVVHELTHLVGKRHFVCQNSREFKDRFETSIRAVHGLRLNLRTPFRCVPPG
jgi:predicted SprT family Zn-dependent metalloprotease